MMKNELIKEVFKTTLLYEPFSYQIEIINKILSGKKINKIIINKSRQIGITTTFEFIAVILALEGKKSLIISKSYSEATNFISECSRIINRLALKFAGVTNKIKIIRTDHIEFTNGGFIRALANTTEAGRSYSVDFLFLDEFAIYRNATELYNAVIPTISTKNEYIIIINSTPKGEGNLYWEIWNNAEKYGYEKMLINYRSCPVFTNEKINDLRKTLDDLGWRQEYENEFLGSHLSYFTLDLLKSCVDEKLQYTEYPEQLTEKLIFGIDIGRLQDKTALVGLNEKSEVKFIKTLEKATFDEQYNFIKLLIPKAKLIRIDTGGIGMQITEQLIKEASDIVEGIILTNEVKTEGFIQLRRMFESKTIKLPNHSELRTALNLIERKQIGTTITFDGPRRDDVGHCDLAIALMLATYSTEKEKQRFKILSGL